MTTFAAVILCLICITRVSDTGLGFCRGKIRKSVVRTVEITRKNWQKLQYNKEPRNIEVGLITAHQQLSLSK